MESNSTPPPQQGLMLGNSETPVEAAATMFGLYAPKLETMLKSLSTGELRRLVNALVQYPINDKEFIDDTRRNLTEAFVLSQRLLEAKWVMIMQSLMDYEQKLLQQNAENGEKQNEVKESENG